MHFPEILKRNSPSISFELFPPKNERAAGAAKAGAANNEVKTAGTGETGKVPAVVKDKVVERGI